VKRAACIAALALALGAAAGQVAVPSLSSRITDLTGTLSGDAVNRIEAEIGALEATRGSRIAVLIVPTTQPEEIEQYGARVIQGWRAARGASGDSALLLVAKDDRRVRVEVDKGLARALPAGVAGRIVDEVIAPHFELGDFDGGVEAGVHQMISVVNGETLPDPDRGWLGHRGWHRLTTLLAGAFFGAGALWLWMLRGGSGGGSRRRGWRAKAGGPEGEAGRDLGGASGRW
jgi:uncharacterized protein